MVRNNNASASPAWPYGAWDTGPHLAGLPRDGGCDALLGFLSAFTASRQQQGTRRRSCTPWVLPDCAAELKVQYESPVGVQGPSFQYFCGGGTI